jgi:dihydroflavonol-4-reductase
MKLFITGATGFVGSVLIPRLVRDPGIKGITALVLPGEKIPSYLQQAKISVILGDITDLTTWEPALSGHTHMIHLAGLISYNRKDRDRLYQVNCLGTQNVVDACLKKQISRLVHISSVGAIGFNKNGEPADETTPYNWPKCFYYMSTKYQGQKIVEKAIRESNLDAVILNPSSILGPGDLIKSSPQNQILDRLFNKTMVGSFSGGLAVVDVRDLVEVIIRCLTKAKFKYPNYLITGENLSYQDTLKILAVHARRKIYPFRVPPVLLTGVGGLTESISSLLNKNPLITYSYGRLSGWFGYYSNKRSISEFSIKYTGFEKTAKDACDFFSRTFPVRKKSKTN